MTGNHKATAVEIRQHYESLGYQVRISTDGHIEFRRDDGAWREAGLVSDYRLYQGQVRQKSRELTPHPA
jgi:hypothetical protein